MRRFGRFLVRFLAIVGLLTLTLIGLGLWTALHVAETVEPTLPKKVVLTLDLDGKFHETKGGDPLARLAGEKDYSIRRVVDALDAAAADQRVSALFATLGHSSLGLAKAQEVRDAVARFRASGKPAVLFAETLGEFGSGTLDVYLASAFGQVWLQPSGDVGLTGLAVESPFLKGTLDLLGIKPQFAARHEYKSAIETFTGTGFSEPHKQNLGQLLDSWSAQIVEGIAAGRRLPPDRVKALLGKGPFLAAEAVSAGLVDKLGYRDAALAAAGEGKEVDLNDYWDAAKPKAKGARVAVITGAGAIHRGESDRGFGGGEDFGSDTIGKAFRDAIEDKEVKAVLFRVDSPGGSYTASDTVWNEVRRARAAGKPVVVSMGNVAASGGYFVAMGADRIIAQPGTITGSIGVFTGKMVMKEFWPKLGVTWDEMHRGDNAGMWSANEPFSPAVMDRLNALLDHIYADFTGKASEGRRIGLDKLDGLARGRIWSGVDAKAGGLVDQLGGWHEAKAAVRELAQLPPDAPLALVAFPRPRTPLEKLMETLSGGPAAELRAGLKLVRLLEPVAAALSPMAQGDALLWQPPVGVSQGRGAR